MYFRVYSLDLDFKARRAISFSEMASNVFRGAFGHLLRDVSTEEDYRFWFEPKAASGPSGLRERPRPFVIRAEHLNNRAVAEGEMLSARLVLFSSGADLVTRAFEHWDRARLTGSRVTEVVLPLSGDAKPVHEVSVEFLTPVELKTQGGLAALPDFTTLASRLCERISTLSALYGEGALKIDFKGFQQRANQIQLVHHELRPSVAKRKSGRTQQTHPLGGFTGSATYSGDLGQFLHLLRIGEWTGVGRQTVWGKGAIKICD